MKTVPVIFVLSLSTFTASHAATLVNHENETQIVIVTEGGSRADLSVDPEQTVDFCPTGCFIALPNGDRLALEGSETIELRDGSALIR